MLSATVEECFPNPFVPPDIKSPTVQSVGDTCPAHALGSLET